MLVLLAPAAALAAPGTISTVAGSSTPGFLTVPGGYSGDGGPATAAELDRPLDVAWAPDGSFFIADAANGVIRKVSTSGTITTFAVVSGYGYYDGSIDVDSSGNVIAGTPASVVKLSPSGSLVATYAVAGIDVAVDSSDNIYALDDEAVRKITPSGAISVVAGQPGTPCVFPRQSGVAPTSTTLCDARSLAVGSDGALYIADGPGSDNAVRKVDAGLITTIAGDGPPCTCPLFENRRGNEVRWTGIGQIQVDPQNNVWVSGTGTLWDTVSGYIRMDARTKLWRLVTRGGGCSYQHGGGWVGNCFAGDGGHARDASLRLPRGSSFAADGTMLIADSDNQRIRRIEAAPFAGIDRSESFGSISLGSSATKAITVVNTGFTPLHPAAPTFSGTHAAEYSVHSDSCAGASIAPGGMCTIVLRLTPAAAGDRVATMTFNSDSLLSSDVSLTGTGVHVERLAVSPGVITFPPRTTGTASPPVTVTLSNIGTGPVSVTSVGLVGQNPTQFGLSADTCTGATLAPGASCTFGAAYGPSVRGIHSATVSIQSSSTGGSPFVALRGSSGPFIQINPGRVVFDAVDPGQTAAARTVTVRNVGSDPLVVGTVALAGPNAGAFTITGDACSGQSVAPAGTCAIDLTFTPSSPGPRAAALDIPSDSIATPATVIVEGTGNDVLAPVTTIATGDGEILFSALDNVKGSVTDDYAGVREVRVTFTSDTGTSTRTATLSCNAPRTSCTWSVRPPPLRPGVYDVGVVSIDREDNLESPGPAHITILII